MFTCRKVFTCKNYNIAAPPCSSVVKLIYCFCSALKMTHATITQGSLGDFLIFLSLSLVGPLLLRTVPGSTWQFVLSWQILTATTAWPRSCRLVPHPQHAPAASSFLENWTSRAKPVKAAPSTECAPGAHQWWLSSARQDLGVILSNTSSASVQEQPPWHTLWSILCLGTS